MTIHRLPTPLDERRDQYWNNFVLLFILLGLLLAMSSCASVKVVENSVQASGTFSKPTQLYVQSFSTESGEWNVDREGSELTQFKQKTAADLRQMMIERFPAIAPTAEAPTTLPASGLLIDGEFTRVNQGSRALRMGIGFGAGGTKMETTVRLYDLSRSQTEPIATFQTTGGSNAQPGFLGGGPISGSIQAGANSPGLTTDLERTSREIRDFILEKIKR